GAHVVATARDRTALNQAVGQIRRNSSSPGQRVVSIRADASRRREVERMVARVEREFGRIDVLVCNAGVHGPIGPVEEVDWDEWAAAIHINLFGVVLACRAVLPIMRRQGAGKIVMLSGGGATQPLPRFSAYAASKAGVVRFTETRPEGVKAGGI